MTARLSLAELDELFGIRAPSLRVGADGDTDDDDDDAGDGKGKTDDDGKGKTDDDDDRQLSTYERELRKESARYRRELRETQQRLRELENTAKPEAERAIAEAVQARENELTAKHNRELAKLHVAVLAATKLRDADDVALLDLDELAEHADDPRELKRAAAAAIDDLVKRKPYLARDASDDDGDKGDGGKDRKRTLADTVTAGGRDRDDDRKRDTDAADDSWLRTAAQK